MSYNGNKLSIGQERRQKRKGTKRGEHLKKGTKREEVPSRRDSIASAYHHMHTDAKTPEYMNDPYYDASKKRAKKIAEKFPSLDTYMRNKKNRAKIGYDYE